MAKGKRAPDAYRTVFPAFGGNLATLRGKAYRVAAAPHARERIQALRDVGARVAALDLAALLVRLDDLSHVVERVGDFSAAIRAEETRGRLAGFYG